MIPSLVRRSLGPSSLLLAVAATAACGIADPDDPGLRPRIVEQRARWEARSFRDYAAILERRCFCPPPAVEPMRIEVRRGRIVRVLNPDSGEPVDDRLARELPSVDGLFVVLLEAVERDAHRIEVEWHPELGYPTRFFIDYAENVADEELGFRVHGVEPLE